MSRRSKQTPKPPIQAPTEAPPTEEVPSAAPGPWIVRSETMVRLPGSQITWVRPGKVIRDPERMKLLKQQGVVLEAMS